MDIDYTKGASSTGVGGIKSTANDATEEFSHSFENDTDAYFDSADGVDPYDIPQDELMKAQMDSKSVVSITEDIVSLIEESTGTLFSSETIKINKDELLDMVNALKQDLPEQIARADQILQTAKLSLSNAKESAAKIISDAKHRADKLSDREEIIKQSHIKAKAIIAKAEREADSLMNNADKYCEKTLEDLSVYIEKSLSEIYAGRDLLTNRIAEHDEQE
jgi:vacuolar-type H+-ATPase subunit H